MAAQLQSLIIDKLTGIRGQRVLFRDLSVRVDAGRVVSLEGPNGAGKTSLLRMIAGFLPQASGTIAVLSNDAAIEDADERSRMVGWLGHTDAAKPQLTPREVLTFFLRLYGGAGDIPAALDLVGLGKVADLPCQYLSAGQKKRLALARLKLGARPLWLIDEPLSSLDSEGRKVAHDLIAAHVLYGGVVIAATHELLWSDAQRLVLEPAA